MKKQLQLFLTCSDEREISLELIAIRPEIAFIDDNVWETNLPFLATSIDMCSSQRIYLWDRNIVQPLPSILRKDGQYEGPVSGVVVQFLRSRCHGHFLLSGRIAIGTGGIDEGLESSMRGFVRDIWKVVLENTVGNINAVDAESGEILRTNVQEYRAGHYAIEWIRQDYKRKLKDRSTENFYEPVLSKNSSEQEDTEK